MTSPPPCVLCTDLTRDCGTCGAYGAWLAVAHPEPAACLTCTDVGWLRLSGELDEQIAARMHLTLAGLDKHLRRHGQTPVIVPRRTA